MRSAANGEALAAAPPASANGLPKQSRSSLAFPDAPDSSAAPDENRSKMASPEAAGGTSHGDDRNGLVLVPPSPACPPDSFRWRSCEQQRRQTRAREKIHRCGNSTEAKRRLEGAMQVREE